MPKTTEKSTSSQPAGKASASFTPRDKLRANARRKIEDGAVTDTYAGDRKTLIKLLNDALATEYV